MDELTAVRELRAEVGEPDTGARVAARRRLRAAMSGDPSVAVRARRRWAPAFAVPMGVAALVVGVVAANGVVIGDRGGDVTFSQAPDPTAQAFLSGVAQVAASRDGSRPADKPVWYFKRRASYGSGGVHVEPPGTSTPGPETEDTGAPPAADTPPAAGTQPTAGVTYLGRYVQDREDWRGPDGPGRIVFSENGKEVSSDERKEGAASDGGYESTPGYSFNLGDDLVSLADLDALPTEPAKLAAALNALADDVELPGVTGRAQLAGQILGSMPARPALRAALYRYLAELPGARLAGADKAEDGTAGTAVTWTDDRGEVRLIVDTSTSRLVAWEERAADPPSADPLTAYEIFYAEGWVATVQDRPAAG